MIAPACRSLSRDERIRTREGSFERQRAGRRRHVVGVDVVLEDHRDAGQRAAAASLPAVAVVVVIAFVGLLERMPVQVNVGVEMRGRRLTVVRGDARVIHAHEFFGGDDVIVDGILNRGNRRFHEIESLRRGPGAERRAEDNNEQGNRNREGSNGEAGARHAHLLSMQNARG